MKFNEYVIFKFMTLYTNNVNEKGEYLDLCGQHDRIQHQLGVTK